MKPPRLPKLCPCGLGFAHDPTTCAKYAIRRVAVLEYGAFMNIERCHCFYCGVFSAYISRNACDKIFREAGFTGHDGRKPGGMK